VRQRLEYANGVRQKQDISCGSLHSSIDRSTGKDRHFLNHLHQLPPLQSSVSSHLRVFNLLTQASIRLPKTFHIIITMRGLPITADSKSYVSIRSSSSSNKSILSRARRAFNSRKTAVEYPIEKSEPYRHIPQYAAASFLKTTTTPEMKIANEAAQLVAV